MNKNEIGQNLSVNVNGELIEATKKICCLCGKEYNEYGNNPHPLSEEGMCCNVCDITKVLPARCKE